MELATLAITDRGAVRWITVNRPDKLNALNRQVLTDLHAAFDAAADAPGVRAVVLTGAGPKAFVAGADIAEMNTLTPVQSRDFSRHGQSLMRKIERFGKPVIGALNGFTLGGGMELAMACHLRLAADHAKFGQPEINLGLVPGFGGTQRLVRLAGRAAALELCLLGTPISAERALALNLVTRVVPGGELETTAQAMAEQLANAAPQALRGIIDAIAVAADAPLDIGLDFESQLFGLVFSTEDMKEGTGAFLDKRKPRFQGC